MQTYLVILGFIRPLLAMVVEDGGQNRVHLGEERLLCLKAAEGGDRAVGGGGKGWEPGVCLSWGLAFHFPWMGAGSSTLQYISEDAHSLAWGQFPACLPKRTTTPP